MMDGNRSRLFNTAQSFFEEKGSAVMKLSADAAIEVCLLAGRHGLVVARIEGGIWHHPGFEARVDCIWDGANPPVGLSDAEANNKNAAYFIKQEMSVHDAFVITAPSTSGWPHRRR